MLSPNEFATRVLTSLEEIRERVARVETETKHIRHHVNKLEEDMEALGPTRYWANNTSTVSRRKVIGGGSLVGGTIAAVVMAVGKALGLW